MDVGEEDVASAHLIESTGDEAEDPRTSGGAWVAHGGVHPASLLQLSLERDLSGLL